MSDVIVIKGAVTYPITLDPSVWIFDERKIDLHAYNGEEEESDATKTIEYVKGTGAQWDKEMREGALPPSERRSMIEARKALEGDYAMRLAPFIDNAKPLPEATHLRIHREGKEPLEMPMAEAKRSVLQFAENGKPLKETGPVRFYLPEMWKAKDAPIDGITAFEVLAKK